MSTVASQGLAELAEAIRAARSRRATLRIRGGGSKDFYGGPLTGEVLDVAHLAGIVDYEPTELVVTARAGTPISELEALLASENQCLAFEPPAFGGKATLGGVVAAGLSGPRRPFVGAVRDFVLGTDVLDGRGEVLSFGGRVMKNVAGYDVSRLMAGSLGSLGVIVQVSLKVLPRPKEELTLVLEKAEDDALSYLATLTTSPLPLSGSAWTDHRLYLRLAGSDSALARARSAVGGEALGEDVARDFWVALREHQSPWFSRTANLWRVALPPGAPRLVSGRTCYEWNGTQRWVAFEDEGESALRGPELRRGATEAGGHATLFRGSPAQKSALAVFNPRSPVLEKIERRVKAVLDPDHVFDSSRIGLSLESESNANQPG